MDSLDEIVGIEKRMAFGMSLSNQYAQMPGPLKRSWNPEEGSTRATGFTDTDQEQGNRAAQPMIEFSSENADRL